MCLEGSSGTFWGSFYNYQTCTAGPDQLLATAGAECLSALQDAPIAGMPTPHPHGSISHLHGITRTVSPARKSIAGMPTPQPHGSMHSSKYLQVCI